MSSPTWLAARNGLSGDGNATNKSAQINQLLTSHGLTATPQGTPSIQMPNFVLYSGNGHTPSTTEWGWQSLYDGPVAFATSFNGATSIDRLQIPIMPVGAGADLLIEIRSTLTGAPIATSYLPRDHINALASTDGSLSGPLQVPWNHIVVPSVLGKTVWNTPGLPSGDLSSYPVVTYSGNYLLLVAPYDNTKNTPTAFVWAAEWLGSGLFASPVQQPQLPIALYQPGVVVTGDTIVVIGGASSVSPLTMSSTVYTASWDPVLGVIGTWTQQTNLPTALADLGAAYDPVSSTVFAIGGATTSSNIVSSVYSGTLSNGQISSWSTTQLPIALAEPAATVQDGWLIIAGGVLQGGLTFSNQTFYAPIGADGALGPWVAGPTMPHTAYPSYGDFVQAPNFIATMDTNGGSNPAQLQIICWNASGAGFWTAFEDNDGFGWLGWPGLFSLGNGSYELILPVSDGAPAPFSKYCRLDTVPFLSVPISASGLSGTYYVVMQQVGGTIADYLETGYWTDDLQTFTDDVSIYDNGTSTWTSYPNSIGLLGIQAPPAYTTSGIPAHLVSDNGQRITTFITSTSPAQQQLLGICESTQQADGTWLTSITECEYIIPSGGVGPPYWWGVPYGLLADTSLIASVQPS